MKHIGLVVLVIGVSISAAYGARLSPSMLQGIEARGAAQFTAAIEKEAFEAYCEADVPRELAAEDGCPTDGESSSNEDAEQSGTEPTEAQLIEAGQARVALLRTREAPAAVAELRNAWIDALEASIEPSAGAAHVAAPGPSARISEWFSQSGVVFILGFLLVVIGAVVARVGVRREALAGDDKKSEGGPNRQGEGATDFGHLLDKLKNAVADLAGEMENDERSADAHDAIKDKIHDVQVDMLEPLVESRGKLQARYGIGAYAEIFTPLSSAERHLNRAWSAVVDRHWEEAHHSLKRAATEAGDAHAVLDRVVAEQKA